MRLELGQQIKQLRLHRGITEEQLGQSLGLTGQAISKWESNTTMPDIQLLPGLRLCWESPSTRCFLSPTGPIWTGLPTCWKTQDFCRPTNLKIPNDT